MKKWNVLANEEGYYNMDDFCDVCEDFFLAETEEEAIKLAKDWVRDWIGEHNPVYDQDDIENWAFIAKEVIDI